MHVVRNDPAPVKFWAIILGEYPRVLYTIHTCSNANPYSIASRNAIDTQIVSDILPLLFTTASA